MSASNFRTENNSYRKLMGNGLTYHIPPFQRDYSWSDGEWEDLWYDILDTVQEDGEPAHYMGYLVLQSEDDRIFSVIDGQQRLTTLSLIVLAALKTLQRLINEGRDSEKNKLRMDQLRQTYIGYLDPVTLVPQSKLVLNRNNDQYYQRYIVPLDRLPQRNIKASEHALRKAFEWYDRRISQYMRELTAKTDIDEGMNVASLLDRMSDRLFFTVISVTDELNAYKVFETLNARGVRLTSTDLLKNWLFSILSKSSPHPREMKELEERWESIVSRLGAESFPDFLRVHWISRHSFVRQSELFKVIKSRITDRAAVFDLLRGMEDDIETYLALTSPEGSSWPAEWKQHAQALKMFRVRQPFSLLLAAHRVLGQGDFSTVLRACVVISFRYNVICSQPANDQERVYFTAAQGLARGDRTTAAAVLGALQPVYPSDDTFKTAFAEKIFRTNDARNNRIVRYILCRLEEKLSQKPLDFESDTLTVEHILPQHPGAGWDSFTDEEADALTYRLGNMTLLEKHLNRTLENKPYSEKRPVFEQSSEYALTQNLATENATWTPERLATRQRNLARLADSVWRIAQLSP